MDERPLRDKGDPAGQNHRCRHRFTRPRDVGRIVHLRPAGPGGAPDQEPRPHLSPHHPRDVRRPRRRRRSSPRSASLSVRPVGTGGIGEAAPATRAVSSNWFDGGATNSLSDDVVIANVIVEKYDTGGEGDGNGPVRLCQLAIRRRGQGACSATDGPGKGAIPATSEERSRSTVPGIGAVDVMGHVVQVFQDGALVASLELPHQESHPDAWWFRGDEPGELCLWYEEDSTGEYGIVARLSVVPMVPGVTASDYVIEHSH